MSMQSLRPLYLMIKPDPAARAAIARLCAALGIDIRYAPERWHSTLLPLGESTPGRIAAVECALSGFHPDPFTVTFDHIEGDTLKPRKGQRAPGLFQRALAERFATSGMPLPPYVFGLHLNLNYGGASIRRAAFAPLAWPVTQILLIESSGGRHIDRGCWRLETGQYRMDF